jgi:hypothetical protein
VDPAASVPVAVNGARELGNELGRIGARHRPRQLRGVAQGVAVLGEV